MAYRPPKNVRPPQLEGKRSGRPKGSRNWSRAWRDCLWGYLHAEDQRAVPPTAGAAMWQAFAAKYLWQVHDYLAAHGVIHA
jgi:hypothetical protein